jgi:hypothetical protein
MMFVDGENLAIRYKAMLGGDQRSRMSFTCPTYTFGRALQAA